MAAECGRYIQWVNMHLPSVITPQTAIHDAIDIFGQSITIAAKGGEGADVSPDTAAVLGHVLRKHKNVKGERVVSVRRDAIRHLLRW